MTVLSAELRQIKRAKNPASEKSYPGVRSRAHEDERRGSTQRGKRVPPRGVIIAASPMPVSMPW
jgi:hypothetical protein